MAVGIHEAIQGTGPHRPSLLQARPHLLHQPHVAQDLHDIFYPVACGAPLPYHVWPQNMIKKDLHK